MPPTQPHKAENIKAYSSVTLLGFHCVQYCATAQNYTQKTNKTNSLATASTPRIKTASAQAIYLLINGFVW
jgi:hypothetical protein